MSERAGGGPEARRADGLAAESAVATYLEGKGMEIVGRNVRAGGGEIDIVARDGDVLVFVEVRSRDDESFGTPEESVTLAKRRKIVRAAKGYLSGAGRPNWSEARFDVVAVLGMGGAREIRHYPNAFDAKGKII